MVLTATQQAVMRWVFDPDAEPIGLLGGDLRSGKTHIIASALLSASLPREDEYAIVLGQSLGSLERVLVQEIKDQAPAFGLPELKWNHRKQSYSLGANWLTPSGAGQAEVSAVVMGMSAFFVGSDEMNLCDEGAVEYALSRLDRPGARFMGGFNAAPSNHWIKKNWFEQMPHELFVFGADAARDAGFLTQEAYDRYDRVLQGHRRAHWFGVADTGDLVWADPAGLVFPSLIERDAIGGPYSLVECGVDFGLGDSATSAVFFGRCPDRSWETIHEYYEQIEGATAASHAEEIVRIGRKLGCSLFVLDPSALPMRNELVRRRAPVRRGKNDVDYGLDLMEEVLGDGRLRVTAAAPKLLEEGAAYIWNSKRPGHPVRGFDHSLDGTRYWVTRRFSSSLAYVTRKPAGL